MNPRNHETVTEAHDELHAHRHATPDALDNADDVEPLRPQRHAIEQPNRPIAGIDFGFEDQRAVAIATSNRARACDGRNSKTAMVVAAKECSKTCGTVEPRHAHPVDGTVARDERSGPHVAD